jgi:MFS family permease
MLRSASYSMVSASITALVPLIARDLLHGNAGTYGLLLGAIGIGAVIGALFVSSIRERMSVDAALTLCVIIVAATTAVTALSLSLPLTLLALLIGGAAHIIHASILNVSIQLAVPRWVTARALAWYSSSLTGGIAIGAWIWGSVADRYGVSDAMAASAGALIVLALISRALPLRGIGQANLDPAYVRAVPAVALALTGRSGPIEIEVDYRVDPDFARGFYDAMLRLQRARLRNGGFGWRLSRDLADPALWIEHFEFPTWQDYLRHHDRLTEADLSLSAAVREYCEPAFVPVVRRRLE